VTGIVGENGELYLSGMPEEGAFVLKLSLYTHLRAHETSNKKKKKKKKKLSTILFLIPISKPTQPY
ncbi:hypothetical protein, partial [Enterobacter hormaechei]|uniref:hypothetical protein n=1 Tax=Enterobacter hormaechei TaxID=158836 RepID=UPI00207C5944